MTCMYFGYGSLIWKPPPHCIESIPGYVHGSVRRFWQSSNDHRGTPQAPGRVVTLISREYWETLEDPHPYGNDDITWGVACKIDPAYENEVKEYMDYREKNGYTEEQVLFTPANGDKPFYCTTYIGRPDNVAFVGPQDPEALARHILRSHGPSGSNLEYLMQLYHALERLDPSARDKHIEDLVERVTRAGL